MTILLVRHARAGQRDKWKGDDRLRPLTDRGHAQAVELVETLKPWLTSGPARFMSSPWVRCTQTLEPLAASVGAKVVTQGALAEGVGRRAVEAFARWQRGKTTIVLCTHGDVVDEILGSLDLRGVKSAKGSVWVFEGSHATYIAPGATPSSVR